MRNTKHIVFILAALLLAACGSTAKITKPVEVSALPTGVPLTYHVGTIDSQVDGVPAHFIAAIRNHLDAELRRHGLLGSDDTSTHTVRIQITDYRMRGAATRFMFGILAGKDGVKSNVQVVTHDSGELAGESDISTFNTTAVVGPEWLAEMHGKKIAEFLAGKSSKQPE